VRVDYVNVVRGSYSYNAPSDLDYHGYAEIEFTVCDRNGRPAPWLAAKMTAEDKSDIEDLILEQTNEH